MLIPSSDPIASGTHTSLSRRVNANSQLYLRVDSRNGKLIKKGEC